MTGEETVDIRFYPFAKNILMRRYTVKIPSPFCSLACFLALAGALSGCATESSGESMTDDKITANVQAAFAEQTIREVLRLKVPTK